MGHTARHCCSHSSFFIMLLLLLPLLMVVSCDLEGSRDMAAGLPQRHEHSGHGGRHVRRPEVEKYVEWLESVKAMASLEVEEDEASLHKRRSHGRSRAAAEEERVILVDKRVGAHADFHSLQAAINSIPNGNTRRTIIHLAPGTYREKVKIPNRKPFITLLGAGAHNTKITWHDNATTSGTTFKSATFSVMSIGFIARGIAFENSSPAPKPGSIGAQAVAFQISGDKAAIYDCAFYGAQDTLYDHKGRHYFKNCLIEGSIDFIFGNGQSIYEGCELRTIQTTGGSLTAQKRKVAGETTGFVFLNCTVGGQGLVLLGRAWGTYSRVVFIYSYLADIILPGGYYDWGIPSRRKTSFYGEYKCFGPGANRHTRVAWSYKLDDAQVRPFLSLNFIDGNSWLTSTS